LVREQTDLKIPESTDNSLYDLECDHWISADEILFSIQGHHYDDGLGYAYSLKYDLRTNAIIKNPYVEGGN